jgi:hypothetical protein
MPLMFMMCLWLHALLFRPDKHCRHQVPHANPGCGIRFCSLSDSRRRCWSWFSLSSGYVVLWTMQSKHTVDQSTEFCMMHRACLVRCLDSGRHRAAVPSM